MLWELVSVWNRGLSPAINFIMPSTWFWHTVQFENLWYCIASIIITALSQNWDALDKHFYLPPRYCHQDSSMEPGYIKLHLRLGRGERTITKNDYCKHEERGLFVQNSTKYSENQRENCENFQISIPLVSWLVYSQSHWPSTMRKN